MATLTIRNVDPELRNRLRVRAAQHGRSMEVELRQILKDVVGAKDNPEEGESENLADAIRRRFVPFGGVELDIPPREPGREPPTFDE